MAIAFPIVTGCDAGPVPVLSRMDPFHGYNDQVTQVILTGDGFWPGLDLDLSEQSLQSRADRFEGWVGDPPVRAALRDFVWLDRTHLRAVVDAGLPRRIQPYPVTVIDPRGRATVLANAFFSLGPDHTIPVLQIDEPARSRKLAPGARFVVDLVAWDPPPGSLSQVEWEVHGRGLLLQRDRCPVAIGQERTVCRFDLQVPEDLVPGDLFEIIVTVIDASSIGNRARERLSYTLHKPPHLHSVTPAAGSMQGGNDVLIRGEAFIEGTRIFIGDAPLLPDGGRLIDAGAISGKVPALAHEKATADEITVPVRLVATTGEDTLPDGYRYLSPPIINQVSPLAASSAGGTPMAVRGSGFTNRTRVFFGPRLPQSVPMITPHVVSATEILGLTPPGQGPTHVWVADPDRGSTVWSGTFTWVDAPGAQEASP